MNDVGKCDVIIKFIFFRLRWIRGRVRANKVTVN